MFAGITTNLFNNFSKNSKKVEDQNSDRLINFLKNKDNKIILKKIFIY